MSGKKYRKVEYPEIQRAPYITHAKENIIQVLEDFKNATSGRDSKIILNTCNRGDGIYDNEKYLVITQNKTPLSTAKYNPHEKWHTIRKDVFNCLVDLLHDFDCLTISDNRLLYQTPEAYFHSTNFFLQNDNNYNNILKKFVGHYRSFTISTLDNNNQFINNNISPEKYMVLIGKMEIKHNSKGNYFTVNSMYRHTHGTLDYKYNFEGSVNYFCTQNNILIQEKFFSAEIPMLRKIVLLPQFFQESNFILMEGIMQMIEASGTYSRSFIIDSKYSESEISTVSINSNKVPEDYKKILCEFPPRKFIANYS